MDRLEAGTQDTRTSSEVRETLDFLCQLRAPKSLLLGCLLLLVGSDVCLL